MTWTELQRLALVGLNRADWRGNAGRAPEAELLDMAARQTLARRAGWQPQPLPPETADPAPAPEDERPWAGEEASRLLEALLGGQHPPLLAEWLGLARAYDQLVRPRHLPRLLGLAEQASLDRPTLLRAIGARGQWLAAQHPQWRTLLPLPATTWQTGNRAEQARYLAQVRAETPAEGRALLTPLIEQGGFRDLAALLPALQEGLSTEDLPLLDPLATHGRKEVRRVALPLLAQLAQSQLVQQAQTQAGRWLQRRGQELVVHLPEKDDVAWLSDYKPQPPLASSDLSQWSLDLGQRARWLVQTLSLVPPTHWPDALGESPEKLLRRLPDHPWGMALLRGWLLAALNHQDATWGRAILRLLLYPKHDPGLRGAAGYAQWLPPGLRSPLMQLVPQAAREHLLEAAMSYVPLTGAPMPFWLLLHSPVPVGIPVAKAFAHKVYSLLQAGQRTLSPELRQFVQSMRGVAFVLPAPYFHELLSTWALNPAYPQWYDPQLEGVIQLMAFRHRLGRSFEQ